MKRVWLAALAISGFSPSAFAATSFDLTFNKLNAYHTARYVNLFTRSYEVDSSPNTHHFDTLMTPVSLHFELFSTANTFVISRYSDIVGHAAAGEWTNFNFSFPLQDHPWAIKSFIIGINGLSPETVSIRNFEYQYVAVPGDLAGIPEPSSWAMLIAGFGMAGSAIRMRGRRKPVAI
jgi:PEP-CTERM putative exosortase interaction domain